MMKVPWWVLVGVAVAGFLAGAFLADFRNAKAQGRAEEAERQAEVLRERARADSVRMATLREEYEAERAAHMASTAAAMEAQRRAEADARARRTERVVLVARSDSLARLLADTATVVPRRTWEAARAALAAAVADAEAQGRRADALASEGESWRILWVRADSGWNTALEHIAGLNEALAAQVRATEAWRRAAKPTWGTRALQALPPLAVGGALVYVFVPGR